MTFNVTQHEETIKRIEGGLIDLSHLVQRLPAATASAAGSWYMTDGMSAALFRASDRLMSAVQDVLKKIGECYAGAWAPFQFFMVGREWTDVRERATSIAGDLQPIALSVDGYWKGRAADAYTTMIPFQITAATRLGVMADKTSTALTWSAAAGAAFYVGLLAVIVQVIVILQAAGAALFSGPFAWVGILAAAAGTLQGLAEIAGLTALLVAALAAQGIQMDNLYSEAGDNTAFPHHRWPSTVTDRYGDATVKDGDADWSLEQR